MQKGDIFTAIFACGAASDACNMEEEEEETAGKLCESPSIFEGIYPELLRRQHAQKMRREEEAGGAPFENSFNSTT